MDSQPIPAGLLAVAAAGLLLGLSTGGAMWAAYPPPRGATWILVGIAAGSVLLAVTLVLVLVWLELRTVADWFLSGYALAALVLVAAVIALTTVTTLRVRSSGSLGARIGRMAPPHP